MKPDQPQDREEERALAVALAYAPGDAAPKVVAKGRGLIAEAIIARARESEIYVHQSAEMVALLMQVDLDDRIPPQLYLAVAELLAWLYRVEQEGENTQPNTRR
jgi:flagellar biosynthesis protein